MNNMALEIVSAYMTSKGMNNKIFDKEKNVLEVEFASDNINYSAVYVVFGDQNDSCQFKIFYYCKFPKEKRQKMYELCSIKNSQYRWVKFFVEEEDDSVTIASDAFIQLDSCGDEVLRVVSKMMTVADDAYPDFMKATWS